LPLEVSQRKGAQSFAAPPLTGTDSVPSALQLAVIAEHAPAAQKNPEAQSAPVVHDVLHAVVPHAYGEHDIVVPAAHAPCPSQCAAEVRLPFAHDAGVHSVSGPFANPTHFAWSEPSHASARHASPPPSKHAARAPWGLPGTALHVPSAPATSQASH
jgi:hypothetical protein